MHRKKRSKNKGFDETVMSPAQGRGVFQRRLRVGPSLPPLLHMAYKHSPYLLIKGGRGYMAHIRRGGGLAEDIQRPPLLPGKLSFHLPLQSALSCKQ